MQTLCKYLFVLTICLIVATSGVRANTKIKCFKVCQTGTTLHQVLTGLSYIYKSVDISDCVHLSRFIPYCSSDVWSGNGPAPTPPPRQRQGREKERDRNTNASKFLQGCSFFTSMVLWINWHVFLLSAEYTFMGSLIIREVIKDLIPKGIKLAKVVMLSGTRWVCFIILTLTTPFGRERAFPRTLWIISNPNIGCILLSTIKMFTVICGQWHDAY